MFDNDTFDITVAKLKFEIKIWTLCDYKFALEKIGSAKYFLHVYSDGREVLNHNNVHFEIHYNEIEQLVALYFWNGYRGWYLNTTDVFDMDDMNTYIAACIGKKFDVAVSVFEKHKDSKNTSKNVVEEIEALPTKFRDFAFAINDSGKVVFVVKVWYEKSQEIKPFKFPEHVEVGLTEIGIFKESDNVWVEDGRYLSKEQMIIELDNLGFSYSRLLKENL